MLIESAPVDETLKRPAPQAGRPLGLSPGQAYRTCMKGISIRGVRYFPEGAERRGAGWYVSTAALRELFAKAADAARGITAQPARRTSRAHQVADAACAAAGL